MSTTLEPTGDRILVEPVEEETVTKSGIILPDQAREKPHRGKIIALGPEVGVVAREKLDMYSPLSPQAIEAIQLQLGDEVLYSKYGGTELKVDLKEVVLLRESDIFCRVQERAEEDDLAPIVDHAGELDEHPAAVGV